MPTPVAMQRILRQEAALDQHVPLVFLKGNEQRDPHAEPDRGKQRGDDTAPGDPDHVVKPDATILCFGDSLTHGNGADPDEAYPAVLAELIGRTVINGGVPGEVTAAGVARLPGLLDEYHPALVVLLHAAGAV